MPAHQQVDPKPRLHITKLEKRCLHFIGILVLCLGLNLSAFAGLSDRYVQSTASKTEKKFSDISAEVRNRKIPPLGPLTDPSLWTSEGLSHKLYSDESVVVDLGNGVTRRDFVDGNSVIQGLLFKGIPIYALYTRKSLVWTIDMARIGSVLSGNDLSQSVLTVKGRSLHIFSQSQPSESILSYIADAVREAPQQTFALLMDSQNPEIAIYLFDSLGEKRTEDGKVYPVHGIASDFSAIALESSSLESKQKTAELLYHEAGHLLDKAGAGLSQSILGEDGKPIFGSGGENDYVSPVAKQNAYEDFAETHSQFLMLRAAQLKEGKDLLNVSPAELDAFLKVRGYSIRLREKFEKIAELYRS